MRSDFKKNFKLKQILRNKENFDTESYNEALQTVMTWKTFD